MFIFCWNPAPFLTRKKTQENQLTWNKLIRLSLIKLYYKNFSFRYIYASYHSSFSIPSGYGIMFIHLLRKSDSKKLFGVLRTSEYSATSTKRNFRDTPNSIFFFYLGFLLRPFMNHRTAREGGGHFFNSSLPLPPASQTLRY